MNTEFCLHAIAEKTIPRNARQQPAPAIASNQAEAFFKWKPLYSAATRARKRNTTIAPQHGRGHGLAVSGAQPQGVGRGFNGDEG
jgi:hypothetical protein